MKKMGLLIGLLSTTAVGAQNTAAMRARLAQPTDAGARVTVIEHDGADTLVRRIENAERRLRFLGWRIRIFFDNGVDARGRALAARSAFAALFPGVPVEVSKQPDSPYFTVTAGHYATAEEATIMHGRIAEHFPEAIPMREEMTAADFVR